MSAVVRNVRDIAPSEREVLEQVVGEALHEDQRLIIEVVESEVGGQPPPVSLPEWCNVYEGLTDAEIDRIEKSIVRSPSSRAS